jgi:hypothetical protein
MDLIAQRGLPVRGQNAATEMPASASAKKSTEKNGSKKTKGNKK